MHIAQLVWFCIEQAIGCWAAVFLLSRYVRYEIVPISSCSSDSKKVVQRVTFVFVKQLRRSSFVVKLIVNVLHIFIISVTSNPCIRNSRPLVFYEKVIWNYAANLLVYNFIKITLRYGSSPVNLLHILRKSFYKNSYGRLLLMYSYHQMMATFETIPWRFPIPNPRNSRVICPWC